MKEFLSERINLTNLLIFVYLFCAASFNYYLNNFYLKYIPGSIYLNTVVSSLAEWFSTLISGFIAIFLGSKNGFTASFAICSIAGIVLLICENNENAIASVPYIVLAAKFGISLAFTLLYMCTLIYFPSMFLGRVFGICNVTARALTILAPMVAEAEEPIPETTIFISCLAASILSRCLTIPQFNKPDE